MRKLTAHEKSLLWVLGLALFLVGNIAIFRFYLSGVSAVSARLDTQERTIQECREIIDQRMYWAARQEWMMRVPPQPYDGARTETAFVESIQHSLGSAGVTIDSQRLDEPRIEGELVVTNLTLSVKSGLEQIVRWLNRVQQPGNYLMVETLQLQQVDGGSAMAARLRISKISTTAGTGVAQ